MMQTDIFACVHNAGRSQLPAAFFNQLAERTKERAVSAGTDPVRVHWPLKDPKGLLLEIRLIQDDIKSRVVELLKNEDQGPKRH